MHCYVLTGGRSRRMGESKTALFLPRIVAAAGPVFEDVFAVQRPGGEAVGLIETVHEEPHSGEGPVFGVVAALRHAALLCGPPARLPSPPQRRAGGPLRTGCFILAVDYPFITADVLRFLAEDGRVPVWNDRPQPLCARWDTAFLALAERRIAAGRYDLRGLLAEAGAEMIAEAELRRRFEGEPLRNVNTPAERDHG